MGCEFRDLHRWVTDRELGRKRTLHHTRNVKKELYSAFKCVRSWDPRNTVNHTHHGGLFNFDFSPDGSLLVAACERKSVLMFDPFNAKLLSARNNAHNDCVNCVKFLDTRMFATCSDDTTVCLWDARYLKHKIRTLRGHSNWVKNIEYVSSKELLVTSGFDGSIYAWDINKYSESECSYKRVFHTNGLMRTKITPDGNKLIIATAGGYLMVIHNLDLSTLSRDLHGFKPNMYRLMQVSQSVIRPGYTYNHLFTRKRNRVQLISDFPPEDEAEMIASLEVHPQGWCAVSRNTSSDERSEWTCVHDIQADERDGSDDLLDDDVTNRFAESDEDEDDGCADWEPPPPPENNFTIAHGSPIRIQVPSPPLSLSSVLAGGYDSGRTPVLSANLPGSSSDFLPATSSQGAGSVTSRIGNAGSIERLTAVTDDAENDEEEDEDRTEEDADTDGGAPPGMLVLHHSNAASESDTQTGSPTDNNSPSHSPPHSPPSPHVYQRLEHDLRLGESITFIIRSESQTTERTLLMLGPQRHHQNNNSTSPKIQLNKPGLTHYAEEPNVGRGFIKEVCFSSDGRLICSPFSYGIRLLAFDADCSELCDCSHDRPHKLYEVTSNMSHSCPVVTAKFSPSHCLLVSGCLNGKVDFHQPRL